MQALLEAQAVGSANHCTTPYEHALPLNATALAQSEVLAAGKWERRNSCTMLKIMLTRSCWATVVAASWGGWV